MRIDIKKLGKGLPFLHTPLMLGRRIWKERSALPALARDYFETRKEAGFLRQVKVSRVGKVLSVFALDDESIYSLKQMALIAQALRLRGWIIRVVFRNQAMVLGKAYFRAFGIDDFVYLSDERLSEKEIQYCRDYTDRLLDRPVSLQTVKMWQFEDSWIGPQIISTLSRIRFEGMVDFSDPAVRLRLKEMLPSCLEHVIRARKLLKNHPADLALTIEANYAVFGPLVDTALAKGTPVIQMVQPWKDDGLIFRRLTKATRREHPSSVALETLDAIARQSWTDVEECALNKLFADRYGGRWFLQARNQKNTRAYTRKELVARYGLDEKKPIAAVFSHVLWDANLFYGDDLFEDYGEWFVETVRAACANPALNWLIKIHPANRWKRAYENVTCAYAETTLIKREIGELPPHVRLIEADDDVSTLSLFENIDYGVTVRGTSGMELACFGKHCITAGTGRYSGLGFTLDCASQKEYIERLAHLQNQKPMTPDEVRRAKWHAYTAFLLRPWNMKSARAEFSYKEKGRHPLDHNLRLTVRSIEELDLNRDLSTLAEWAEGPAIDYISSGGSAS